MYAHSFKHACTTVCSCACSSVHASLAKSQAPVNRLCWYRNGNGKAQQSSLSAPQHAIHRATPRNIQNKGQLITLRCQILTFQIITDFIKVPGPQHIATFETLNCDARQQIASGQAPEPWLHVLCSTCNCRLKLLYSWSTCLHAAIGLLYLSTFGEKHLNSTASVKLQTSLQSLQAPHLDCSCHQARTGSSDTGVPAGGRRFQQHRHQSAAAHQASGLTRSRA